MAVVWQTFDSIWRSVIAAFWRLPLLVIASLLLYVVLSAYWFHYLPIHISGHIASQVGYILLHAIIFTPLVLAVMAIVMDGQVSKSAIWARAALPIGTALFLYEFADLALNQAARAMRTGAYERQAFALYDQHHPMLSLLFFAAPTTIAALGLFVLAVRLILILPILRETSVGGGASRGWRAMRGHFGFALAVSLLSALPFIAADHFIMRLYRILSLHSALPGPLPLRQWEALLVRSADITLQFIFYAALAAWLYRVIVVREPTAP